MIVYNMRYRGSIEYEKMLLNILNFYNEVSAICDDEKIESDMQQTIGSYIAKCKDLMEHYQSEDCPSSVWLKHYNKNFIQLESVLGEKY